MTDSTKLRQELISEINREKDPDALALWAHRRFTAKNSLTSEDATAVEIAYVEVLKALEDGLETKAATEQLDLSLIEVRDETAAGGASPIEANQLKPLRQQVVTPRPKQVSARNKSHLRFVAAQPCLVCRRTPCDAHHVKFAEPRALGRKVSDEFTVPLCREHHQELHRHGNEKAWWANINIAPLETARGLWDVTTSGHSNALLTPDAVVDASPGLAMK